MGGIYLVYIYICRIYLDDLVMCLDDFGGHVGRHIDRFDGVHGGLQILFLSGE